jgi:hypothetical protein
MLPALSHLLGHGRASGGISAEKDYMGILGIDGRENSKEVSSR